MEQSLLPIKLYQVVNHTLCPQCGGRMRELERLKEGTITYVWFECVRAECDGQWMQSYIGLISKQFGQSIE